MYIRKLSELSKWKKNHTNKNGAEKSVTFSTYNVNEQLNETKKTVC